MTKQTAGILLLSGAALWYWVLRGVRAVSVKFEKLRITGIADKKVLFNVSALIYNPLLVTVLVNNIVGDIYIMGIPCAKVNYPLNQRIRSRGTSRITVNFEAYTDQLGEALVTNIATGDIRTMLFQFVGYVTAGGINIKIDKSFTFNDLFGHEGNG